MLFDFFLNWHRDCDFKDCYQASDGGVAVLRSPLNITMENCDVSGNVAANQGAVFYITVGSPTDLLHVHLVKSKFSSNKAVKGGSVMYLEATGSDATEQPSEVLLEDCTVTNNEASTPIYILGSGYVNVTVIGGSFTNNEDRYWGGAIGLDAPGHVVIEDATFDNNKVTAAIAKRTLIPSGGAVRVKDMKSMTVSRCTFKNNEVKLWH